MQKVVQMNGKQLRPLYLREAKNRKDVKGKKGSGDAKKATEKCIELQMN